MPLPVKCLIKYKSCLSFVYIYRLQPKLSGHEKKLSTEIKQTIVRLKNEGHSGRKIEKLLDIDPSTINKFLKRYNERGDVENKHRSRRPRKCNGRTDRQLLRIVKTNRRKTLQDVTATLNEESPVKLSHSTVRRRLSGL